MPSYDSFPLVAFSGHAIVNATTDPGPAVACPAIPVPLPEPTGCRGKTPHHCLDKRTNPATSSCVGMRYVFPRHEIRNGYAKTGVTGAYLPAATVCKAMVTPVPLSQLRQQPNAGHYGLPEDVA